VVRRVLAVCACAIALVGCRLDVAVDMTVEPDGTGSISVVAVGDAELVAAVPTIADDLATDDIVAAGWQVSEPTPTPEGGLSIALSHDFASAEEATNLLASLGPPFGRMALERNTQGNDTTTRLTGLLGLSNGFETFADDDLIAAVGSVPFAEQLAASGATPESSMGFVMRATLPGEIDGDETNGTDLGEGRYEWTVPLDGTILEMRAVATQSPGSENWWARPLSVLALVALIGWVGFMSAFIAYVAWARRQRRRGRPREPGRSPRAAV
jgi:hypothetical protein